MRQATPYDLDENKSVLHSEYMKFVYDSSDPWGSHVNMLYDTCLYLMMKDVAVPQEYGFHPGMDNPTRLVDDWYLYEIAEELPTDTVLMFAADIEVQYNRVKADGLDY